MSKSQNISRLWLTLLPVAVFVLLAAIFWKGLSRSPSELPSALIGRPVPEFSLAPIEGLGVPGFDSASLRTGRVTVVNVWASWCAPCRIEHPFLMMLAKRPDIRLFGINYKDDPENARRFLGTLGQPFAAVGSDEKGRAALDWGVYGVPETFIVDGAGVIRYKWIGPLSAGALAGVMAAEIEKAKSPAR